MVTGKSDPCSLDGIGGIRLSAEAVRGRVLYEDRNIVIFDKPAGLAVHEGPSTPIHLEGMLGPLALSNGVPPRPAHRLDRDTAGCLVLARHDKAASRLGRLFGGGLVKKTYWTVVEGKTDGLEGTVDLPLAKSNSRAGWKMIVSPEGKAAVTHWRVMGAADGLTWLELEPMSGRTHQIRVHCASGLGCPVLGDPVYGKPGPMMHLLSRRIVVPYWAAREAIAATAPVPGHMREALTRCGWREFSVRTD